MKKAGVFAVKALFATITNANFDDDRIKNFIAKALSIRDELRAMSALKISRDTVSWSAPENERLSMIETVGILAIEKNEDLRSLQELIIYGLKGMTAYAGHAEILEKTDQKIYDFILEAHVANPKNLSKDDLFAPVLRTGEMGVTTMALLNHANTSALNDIDELPVSFDIEWYEQKEVIGLLALLYLEEKGIRLGPTLPAFLSENVAKVLVENFDIKPIGSVKEDVAAMMGKN